MLLQGFHDSDLLGRMCLRYHYWPALLIISLWAKLVGVPHSVRCTKLCFSSVYWTSRVVFEHWRSDGGMWEKPGVLTLSPLGLKMYRDTTTCTQNEE